MLEIKNIISGYRKDNPILKGVSLRIKQNEVVAIIGQNGAGKSTLAKTIMNMVPYISGDIFLNGKPVTGINTQGIVEQGVGFFFQGGRVFPHLTVEENLAIAGMSLGKKAYHDRKREMEQYFNLLNSKNNHRFKLQASYLSGGEQHQLALAMVLMKKPKLLILDEPSAGLSPGNVKRLYDILIGLKENLKMSFLLIEQNVKMAFEFGDKLFLLKDGTIEEQSLSLENVEEKYFNN